MAKRPIIKVTDLEALEKWAVDSNFPELVGIVTEKRADPKMLRGLVRNALALKQTIPGVEVSYKTAENPNQTELEKSIAEKKAEASSDAEVEKTDTAEKSKLQPIKKPTFGAKKRA